MPDETTQLDPLEEILFKRWAQSQGLKDVDHPDSHYDYRGFFLSQAPHTPGTHWPDTFKTHGHPTFSVESQYSKGPFDGGMWSGEKYLPQMTPAVSHAPSLPPDPHNPKIGPNPHPIGDKISQMLSGFNPENFKDPNTQPGIRAIGAIRDMIGRASETPLGQAAQVGLAATPFIKAFHASPHDFERFDLSKIGTGEGAQSYGHGLYFAENPEVADTYKKSFTEKLKYDAPSAILRNGKDPRLTYGNGATDGSLMQINKLATQYPDRDINDIIDTLMLHHPTYKGLLDQLRHSVTRNPEFKGFKQAKTYEVGIKADPSSMVQWDKFIKDQPEGVKDLVQNFEPLKQEMATYGSKYGNVPTGTMGGQIYEMLADSLSRRANGGRTPYRPFGQHEASEILKSKGVPGIKYFDGDSRALALQVPEIEENIADINNYMSKLDPINDQDALEHAVWERQQLEKTLKTINKRKLTSNYVVFDDKIIDILKKYGIAGAAGGSLMNYLLGNKKDNQQ